jgi:flagellar assembly protein FliH
MAAELVSRAPEAEIEALIRRSLALLAGEPRVVVRLAPAMFDRLGPRLDGLSLGSAFAGQIVLVGDESLGPGDCRIEWADGGTVRDEAAAWREIEAFAERAVGPAPAATPPAADPPPAEQETP